MKNIITFLLFILVFFFLYSIYNTKIELSNIESEKTNKTQAKKIQTKKSKKKNKTKELRVKNISDNTTQTEVKVNKQEKTTKSSKSYWPFIMSNGKILEPGTPEYMSEFLHKHHNNDNFKIPIDKELDDYMSAIQNPNISKDSLFEIMQRLKNPK